MIKTSLDIILENLRDLRIRYVTGPGVDAQTQATCDMLDEAIKYANILYTYFSRLESLLDYIVDGLSLDANNPNSFLDYKKSFSKEKFKNNSKNTSESIEKFAFYKQKFYEIFD